MQIKNVTQGRPLLVESSSLPYGISERKEAIRYIRGIHNTILRTPNNGIQPTVKVDYGEDQYAFFHSNLFPICETCSTDNNSIIANIQRIIRQKNESIHVMEAIRTKHVSYRNVVGCIDLLAKFHFGCFTVLK